MNHERSGGTVFAILALTAGAVSVSAGAQLAEQAAKWKAQRMEQRAHGLAMYTKLLCSGVFVAGREAEEFIARDLQGERLGLPSWDDIDVDIDREAPSVTLTLEGLPPRTAVYHECQGCTLLPQGVDKVFFEPKTFAPNVPDPKTHPWPVGDVVEGPAAAGQEAIEAVLDFAFDDTERKIPQNTRAMVVVHKDRIVAERYAPGFDKDTRHISWSMGKSITAALVGILVGEGHFDIDDPAPILQWRQPGDPRRAITIRHLLNMSSGLDFQMGGPLEGTSLTRADNHTAVYFGAVDVFDYSVYRGLEFPPNTKWRYRNCDPLALGKIIRDTVEAKGQEYLSWPQRALFDKVSMRNMVLEVDPHGNFILTGFDYGTARDWARFGLLHLHGGVWQGERILPEGWVEVITTPAPADASKGYGGLFWLNAGNERAGVPKDAYWASGHMGQNCIIIPSEDLVVVRLGHSDRGGYGEYVTEVLNRLLAALP